MNAKTQKKPKYPPPVKAIIIDPPKNLAKLKKEELLEKLLGFYQENNQIAKDLAAAQTTVNNLKVDLKTAKTELKALKAGKDAA